MKLRSKKCEWEKYELYIGIEFISDETAHIAYSKHACDHDFNIRKLRRSNKEENKRS